MRSEVKPLSRAVRMSDPDYPGTVRLLGDAWRVAVSPDGRRYRLQPLVVGPEGHAWASPPSLVGASLPKFLEKCGPVVEGLAQACEGLPDDPASAVPELVLQHQLLAGEISGERRERARLELARRDAFFRQSREKLRPRRAVDPS